ncbi:cupin-like domain-containing protein [Variovorax paradoxus]|uniref:cupin-like domain-containing protein n=1 Tax=Variovorax paradoxus TaxID=34073 RepID=UPI0009BEBB4F|nr:cupin-like domain-containing protein [Variovorax paradoxus]
METRYFAIDSSSFRTDFVGARLPLHIKGYGSQWNASKLWGADYFRQRFGESSIQTKRFERGGNIILERERLGDYLDGLDRFERERSSGRRPDQCERPAYWHDVPIFQIFPELLKDVQSFDPELLPGYYRKNWHQYVQFFMGPSGSVTKLHFDTLRTHNLTLQIQGRKVWTLLPPASHEKCGRTRWRWFDVDPEQPDLHRFPDYEGLKPITVIVEPGDLLYVPPGTLHHVRSLDACISFNIDFHTPHSVLSSFRFAHKGMPREVLYFNFISLLGLVLKLPERALFRFYKPYLNYVS